MVTHPPPWPPGGGLCAAVVVSLVAVLLRWPAFVIGSHPPEPESLRGLFLGTDLGLINALGLIGVRSWSTPEALVAVLSVLSAEAWLFHRMGRYQTVRLAHWWAPLAHVGHWLDRGYAQIIGGAGWLGTRARGAIKRLLADRAPRPHASDTLGQSPIATSNQTDPTTIPTGDAFVTPGSAAPQGRASADRSHAERLDGRPPPVDIADEEGQSGPVLDAALGDPTWILRYESTVNECGRPCVAGEARVRFEAGERTGGLAIAFSPVLPGPVQVEAEADHEDVQVEVVRSTEIGTRIAVRRGDASAPLDCTVSFYAASAEDPTARSAGIESSGPAPGSRLP
ncbi:MAG: hypothetical protein D6753_04375 [Planctomycetota bacterium]|nr:MAG: hypothetical protein D6753_04375 [Planctomycetota bacterium]